MKKDGKMKKLIKKIYWLIFVLLDLIIVEKVKITIMEIKENKCLILMENISNKDLKNVKVLYNNIKIQRTFKTIKPKEKVRIEIPLENEFKNKTFNLKEFDKNLKIKHIFNVKRIIINESPLENLSSIDLKEECLKTCSTIGKKYSLKDYNVVFKIFINIFKYVIGIAFIKNPIFNIINMEKYFYIDLIFLVILLIVISYEAHKTFLMIKENIDKNNLENKANFENNLDKIMKIKQILDERKN